MMLMIMMLHYFSRCFPDMNELEFFHPSIHLSHPVKVQRHLPSFFCLLMNFASFFLRNLNVWMCKKFFNVIINVEGFFQTDCIDLIKDQRLYVIENRIEKLIENGNYWLIDGFDKNQIMRTKKWEKTKKIETMKWKKSFW